MRYAIGLGVLAVASAAHAAPVATLATDVDGDGATDHISVDGDGLVRVETAAGGAGTVALGRTIARATVTAAVARGTPTIVVDTDDEAFVIERAGGTWTLARREPIGGVGLDHDYSIWIDATPAGLVRYQARPGIRRCDGKPTYLFAEGWNPATKRFQKLSTIDPLVPDGAPVIAAHPDPAPAAPPILFQARAASHEAGASDAGALGVPAELDDGKLDTAWREDFVNSAGEGQFFTFEARADGAKAAQLRVVAGPRGTNRPHRLAIVAAEGAWHVELPDDATGAAYVADLPAPIAGCVTVVLESTYGPAKGTTAIAELEVYAEGERAGGGEAMLAAAVAAGNGAASASQELARRGAAGVAAIDAELGKTTDAAARRRLVRALVGARDASAAPVLAHAVTQRWVDGNDELDAIETLGALGAHGELHELARASELPLAARLAAVRALASSPELALDLAGGGRRELRHAVIEVATGAAMTALLAAAQQATTANAAGDLWRAVTRRAHVTPADRPAALAAMLAALPAATDYERRYRLIDGIAAIGDAPALATLAAALRGMPKSPELAAFEQVIAHAIAANPRPEAFDLLAALVRDDDPGVRLAALDGLAGFEGGTAGPWHVAPGPDAIDGMFATSLATDTWPELRRRAAQALGSRCTRIGAARALEASVARDPDLDVRGDALAALVQCAAPGAAGLLARVWDDAKAPLPLRQRAVDLAVALGDRELAITLVAKLASWRGAALDSANALALAQNAAYALGQLAPPGAAAALEAGLDDSAYPEIVAASATGLGLLGRACPASIKPRLRELARSDEQQIAIAAGRAAAVCGR
ncbi:MAG TPA: HEAT repeat domain-containing protein [Kofleriaceae bacterium]|nr:HEAT repeat domain-containing protein [Kofleriaceae bacterium]